MGGNDSETGRAPVERSSFPLADVREVSIQSVRSARRSRGTDRLRRPERKEAGYLLCSIHEGGRALRFG